MIEKKSFYFLRHGQTDWNKARRVQGQTDIPLNAKGLEQAARAQEFLQSLNIQTICYSPLERAKKTAEIVNETLQCSMVSLDNLKENNFGVREGDTPGDWIGEWRTGKLVIPQAETYVEYRERVLLGVNEALAHPGPVLIVAHGGFYWGMLDYLNGAQYFDIPNCLPVHHEPSDCMKHGWNITCVESGTSMIQQFE